MQKLPLLVLIGPTAVGKTALSIKLAKLLSGEIISGDSMQVYRYLDIGTAKITTEEMEGVPHHLIDILEPQEKFSVADFQELAQNKIKEISARGKLPILVGGTGLYVDSVIYDNYNFSPIKESEKLRKSLWKIASEKGNNYLIEKLKIIDPISSEKIHPNDSKRLIRALEVFYSTGKPISSYKKNKKLNLDYDIRIFGLYMDREKLYDRINLRVELMLEAGWVEEIKEIFNRGIPVSAPALQGLGYKQLIYYLEKEISYEKTVELIKRDTRRFAKRQLTWFKRSPYVYWIKVNGKPQKYIIEEILSKLGREFRIKC